MDLRSLFSISLENIPVLTVDMHVIYHFLIALLLVHHDKLLFEDIELNGLTKKVFVVMLSKEPGAYSRVYSTETISIVESVSI